MAAEKEVQKAKADADRRIGEEQLKRVEEDAIRAQEERDKVEAQAGL